jgi:hypothetical protein
MKPLISCPMHLIFLWKKALTILAHYQIQHSQQLDQTARTKEVQATNTAETVFDRNLICHESIDN